MKLVTGIEAIQSGKPFKAKDDESWIDKTDCLGYLSPHDLTQTKFIIKDEPREFWIFDLSEEPNITLTAYPITYQGADTKGDRWIRVREVEK